MDFKQLNFIVRNLKTAQVEEFFYNIFARPRTFDKWTDKSLWQKSLCDKAVRIVPQGVCCDHVEMSGAKVSAIISYGVDKKGFLRTNYHLTFPSLRLKPDMTTSSACCNYVGAPEMTVDGVVIEKEIPNEFVFNGKLAITGHFKNGLAIDRVLVPSKEKQALIERITFTNLTDGKVQINTIASRKEKRLRASECLNGEVTFASFVCGEHGKFDSDNVVGVNKLLVPKAGVTIYVVYAALEKNSRLTVDCAQEFKSRDASIFENCNVMTLKTPDEAINTLYSFSLLRGKESVFDTAAGLLHSPGGGNYYASIWANDQLEYVAPAAPLLGKELTEATLNAIELYCSYMDFGPTPFKEKKALPSSIISGGKYPFGIAGDRGDTTMVGLGTAQFLLNYGDKEYARKRLPNVEWCVDFSASRLTGDGVVSSDSDELEGRFPSGKCNLSVNINYYLLLKYAAILERETGSIAKAAEYDALKDGLKQAIADYFNANVEGYDTYRYYEGNKVLRSWICLPLVAWFADRAEGTVKALTERLLVDNRMRTAGNKPVVWDRSLLFALKGIFNVGDKALALRLTEEYARDRLTGVHSPYAYEAYPEGNGAQLAGESVLFARVIIEGLFGWEPVGIGKIRLTPRTPDKGTYRLNKLNYRGKQLSVETSDGEITVTVDKTVINGRGSVIVDI